MKNAMGFTVRTEMENITSNYECAILKIGTDGKELKTLRYNGNTYVALEGQCFYNVHVYTWHFAVRFHVSKNDLEYPILVKKNLKYSSLDI